MGFWNSSHLFSFFHQHCFLPVACVDLRIKVALDCAVNFYTNYNILFKKNFKADSWKFGENLKNVTLPIAVNFLLKSESTRQFGSRRNYLKFVRVSLGTSFAHRFAKHDTILCKLFPRSEINWTSFRDKFAHHNSAH